MSDTVHMIAPDSTSWDVPAESVAQAESTGWHQANAAPAGSQGPGPGADVLPWLLGAGALAAGDRLLPLAGQAAANTPQAAKSLLSLFHPGAGKAIDLMQMFQPPANGPVSPAAAPAAPSAPKAPIPFLNPAAAKPATVAPSLAKLTRADIANFPEFKHYSPGDLVSRKAYEKIKLAVPETSAPVAATPAPKANPRAPGPTIQNGEIVDAPPPGYTESGNKQATPSGPKLVKRQAAIKAAGKTARAAKPAAAAEAAESDLESQLANSVKAQGAMRDAGLNVGEQSFVRAGLRSALNPAAQAILYLLGGAHTAEDMQAAHEQYMRAMFPEGSTRRALTGPSGS